MRTLLATITDKAALSFGGTVTRENWTEWREHWLRTALQWEQELIAEGLVLTAETVRDHYEFELKNGVKKL